MLKQVIKRCLLSLFAASISAQAVTNTWVSATSGNWTNTAGWSEGTEPTSSETVWHTSKGNTLSVTTAAEANSLVVGNNSTSTVSVATGGSLAVGGDAQIGNAGTTGIGKLAVNGGSVSVGGNLTFALFGTSRTGIGELNSGSITVGGYTAIGGNNTGTGILTINSGTFTGTSGNFLVGYNGGPGTLNMNGGILQLQEDTGVLWNPFRIGASAGSGTVNLNGGEIHTGGLIMDQATADAGAATLNFNAGLLQVEGGFVAAIQMYDDAQMVFDEGVLVWKGDRVANFETLVDGGFINWDTASTAMLTENWDMAWTNGTSVLYADYNDANSGYTTVWSAAVPEPAALGLIAVIGSGMLFVRRLFLS